MTSKPREGRHDNMMTLCLAIALLIPATVQAAPVTLGTWSTPPAPGNHWPWWCRIDALLVPAGLEYLHNGSGAPVAFGFDDAELDLALLYRDTDDGVLTRTSSGSFLFDNTRRVADSIATPHEFVLFRQLQPSPTRYVMGIGENDYAVTFSAPPVRDEQPEPDPKPVPEPTILTLFGAGLAGLGYRFRRARE